jgi:hypothetical protein
MEKLPHCKYEPFGKCSKEHPDAKFCVMCMLEEVYKGLRHEEIADATECLNTLYRILCELDAIPKEAKQ